MLNKYNLTTKKPAKGLSPMKWTKIIGKKSNRNYKKEDGSIVNTLYSSYTKDQIDIESEEVDKIKVKGKDELITIYKPKENI